MRTIRAAPKAAMLIESMRDIGYSLETAVADVIDNSITAGASTVHLFAEALGAEAKIGILDDGQGMSEGELLDAMRPGSRNPLEDRDRADLGRFGLGLKTASFSQCRRVTVVTRCDGVTSAAIWDLDYVAATDDWIVQIPDNPESLPWIDRLNMSGTLVIWEHLDRLVDRVALNGDFSQRIMDTMEHLELVFHRYLSGSRGRRKFRILVNERALEPLDPFHSTHPATQHGPEEKILVAGREVVIQAFTLPHHSKVTRTEWERYALPGGYLKNQGIYVYRERRLIIHGTWFRLARQAELTKLTRVRIDIPNGLDTEWKIDVKKASAQPPYQVRERLSRIIERIGAPSKRVYTTHGAKLTADTRLPIWNRIQNKNEIIYQINHEHPVIAAFASRLPDELAGDFRNVVKLVGATLPMNSLFADMAATPEKVNGNSLFDDELSQMVETSVKALFKEGVHPSVIIEMLRVTEPFRSNWKRTEVLLGELSPMDTTNV